MGEIRLARAHDDELPPGRRFLIGRVWPRGISKAGLHLDAWLRDAAPSTELRQWFGHDPARWEEFHRRYTAELEAAPDTWRPLVEAARGGDVVVVVYGAKDTEHHNAVVIRDLLRALPS